MKRRLPGLFLPGWIVSGGLLLLGSAGCNASPSTSSAEPADAASESSGSQGSGSVASSLLNLPDQDLDRFDERWHARVAELEAEIEKSMAEEPMDTGRVGDAFGALGQHYMAHHLVDMATVCFDYAQTVDPEEIRWPYLNGFLHQIQDQFADAEKDYRAALGIEPDHLGARLRLGTVLVEQGEKEEAETLFRAVLDDHADLAAARYELGRLRLDQGRLDEAVELLRQAVDAQPGAGVAQYALGQALRRRGDVEAAKKALAQADEKPVIFPDPLLGELSELGVTAEFYRMRAERAVAEGRPADAVTHYGKAVELGDDGYEMRMTYAFVLHQTGDRGAAQGQLRAALDDPTLETSQRAEIHHRLGLLYTEAGDASMAVEHQTRALAQDPEHVGARLALGDAAARSGRLDEAVELFGAVLARQADNRSALIKRGTALLNISRVDEGLRDLERALELDPEDLDHRLRWIEALEHAEAESRAREAVASLARRLEEQPPEAAREKTVTFTRLGHKLRRYGELAAAERSYRLALEPVPETPDLRMNLADLLMARENHEEALELYGAVLAAQPDHGDARYGRLRATIGLGQWAAARAGLEQALRETQSGRVMHLLARVLAVAPAPTADPERALVMAEEVFNARRTPEHAATLGMALAAAGRFQQAAQWQEQLIADTAGLGEPWTRWLRGQLEAFRAGRPWRPDRPSHTFAPEA